jgi:hypothetical protein
MLRKLIPGRQKPRRASLLSAVCRDLSLNIRAFLSTAFSRSATLTNSTGGPLVVMLRCGTRFIIKHVAWLTCDQDKSENKENSLSRDMFKFKISIPGQLTNDGQALCLKTIVVVKAAKPLTRTVGVISLSRFLLSILLPWQICKELDRDRTPAQIVPCVPWLNSGLH